MNAAIARAVSALENRIGMLERRIQELENYRCPANGDAATLATFENVMETLLRLHTERVSLRARKEVVWAFGKVLESTPARSGYARSGWTITAGASPSLPPPMPSGE